MRITIQFKLLQQYLLFHLTLLLMGRKTKRQKLALNSFRAENGRFQRDIDWCSDDDSLEYDPTLYEAESQAWISYSSNITLRSPVYTGQSRTTTWRRRKEQGVMKHESKRYYKITNFFSSSSSSSSPLVFARNASYIECPEEKSENLQNAIDRIQSIFATRHSALSTLELLKYTTILKYVEYRKEGVLKGDAAERVSSEMPSCIRLNFRTIMKWADHYIDSGVLLTSARGKHQKTISLLMDEDAEVDMVEWLRNSRKSKRCPKEFQQFINSTVIPKYSEHTKRIHINTARKWMKRLGYKYGTWKKNVYLDGHEREDVVSYRKEFCSSMIENHMLRMSSWTGDNMEVEIPHEDQSKSKLIWVCHDETCYWANDDGGKGWSSSDAPDLHKKSRGRALMVSDFICSCHGILENSAEMIQIGKNHEGFWTVEHLLVQLKEKVIPSFNRMHPGSQALFCFDNSTNHQAMASDALVASRMNKGSGGKQPVLRDGWFVDPDGKITVQKMTDANGKPLGLKNVLLERGKWIEGLRLKCGNRVEIANDVECTCCCIHRMASQPDFINQKSALEEVILENEHLMTFFPKFHCELNPIERMWAASKQYVRRECDYSFPSLLRNVPKSLSEIPIAQIRKYFQRSIRLIEAYHKDIPYKLALYAHKKYKSHRRLPDNWLNEVERELAERRDGTDNGAIIEEGQKITGHKRPRKM